MENTSNNQKPSTLPDDIDIRGIINVIWNRKGTLAIIILTGMLITFGLTQLTKTKYTANSSILIENDNNIFERFEDKAIINALDVGFILTEIEILKSRNLAAQIVQKLDLMNDPEFNPNLNKGQDILDTQPPQKIDATAPFKTLTLEEAEISKIESEDIIPRLTREQEGKLQNSETITHFLDTLKASSIPGTFAVKVGFTSKDPEKAALIANTTVNEYIKSRIKAKRLEQAKLTAWLDDRITDLKQQVLENETRVEEHRIENGLISGRQEQLLSKEQLTALNNQLIDIEAMYLDKKAQMTQMRKTNNSVVDSKLIANSVNATILKNLNQERIAIEATIAQLSTKYGPKHPLMIKNQNELAAVQKRISTEVQKSKNNLKNELQVIEEQRNEIKNRLSSASDQIETDNEALIKLREYEREADTSRNILKNFLDQYKRSVKKEPLQNAGARVISYASVPSTPSSPNKILIIMIGAFVSAILGIAILFILEKIYNKFKTTKDIEDATGYTCLGSIPYQRKPLGKKFITHILSSPNSKILEAVRNLRITIENIKLRNGNPIKVLSVLSSVKNEGKTTLAIILAALSVKAGKRTILIDANLRRPEIHTYMNEANGNNLVDYLTSQKTLDDIIYKDPDTNVDIIFGQSIPNNAFNLLSMKELDTLIETLRKSYDYIIIDTPSCLEASDARLIEQLSDLSLFAIKYKSTNDEKLLKALKPFQTSQNKSICCLLTQDKA